MQYGRPSHEVLMVRPLRSRLLLIGASCTKQAVSYLSVVVLFFTSIIFIYFLIGFSITIIVIEYYSFVTKDLRLPLKLRFRMIPSARHTPQIYFIGE